MKTIYSILSLIFVGSLIAQNVTVQKGTETKIEEKSRFVNYIGVDQTGIYTFHIINRTTNPLVIKKTDYKTSKVIYNSEFELIDGSSRFQEYEIQHSMFLKFDKILYFTTKYESKSGENKLLLREFDAKTGKKIGEQKQISVINSDLLGLKGRKFYVEFSPDNSKMAIVNEFKWPKKTSEVSVTIYETTTYKKLGTKTLANSYNNSIIDIKNYRIDNQGSFYYLFKHIANVEEDINGIALASIKANTDQSVIKSLPFDNLEIKNQSFEFANNNLVFCGAFVDVVKRKERKEGKIAKAGFYTFFVDCNIGEIKSKSFDYFSEDVATKLTYGDYKVDENPIDKKYEFEKVITINENVYLIESHSYYIDGEKYHEDIEREYIISKYNNAGKLQWMKIIPKFTTGSGLKGFNYIVKNNKLNLIYI